MKRNGFTLIELLIVIAIIGIIAAIAVPNMLIALSKSRQKGTILVMHNVAVGLEGYRTSALATEVLGDISSLNGLELLSHTTVPWLVPMHCSAQPNINRWGRLFQHAAVDLGNEQFLFEMLDVGASAVPIIASFQGQAMNNPIFYDVTTLNDFQNGVLFQDGMMVIGPNTFGRKIGS